jgi:CubicO group peptidase (beta-lactamase class C family)
VVALCLVRDGRLALDEPIDEHLEGWRLPANGGWRARITLRQLLSHTAGLTVHGFPGYGPHERVPSLPEVLDGRGNTPPVRVASLPGFQFTYSGGGYSVMQQLLVDVSGRAFPDLALELVLGPLGLRNSSYEQTLPPHLAARTASGHRSGGAVVAGGAHRYPEMAAAGLWTTPGDLARFVIGVQESLAGRAGALLPKALAHEMLVPQAANRSYGLGVVVDGAGAERRFSHSGADEGFRGEFVGHTEGGRGVVVMVNSDGGTVLASALSAAVAEVYAWPGREAASDGPSAAAGQPGDTADLVGVYESSEGSLAVAQEDDGLVLRWLAQPSLALAPAGRPDVWRAVALNLDLAFRRSSGGTAVDSLELRQAASYTTPTVFRRVEPGASGGA